MAEKAEGLSKVFESEFKLQWISEGRDSQNLASPLRKSREMIFRMTMYRQKVSSGLKYANWWKTSERLEIAFQLTWSLTFQLVSRIHEANPAIQIIQLVRI
jgi:hypothetical protein